MDIQIANFLDILDDNSMIIKRYRPETIYADDPRLDNFEFNEDLLLSSIELYDNELEEFLEHGAIDRSTAISIELNRFHKIDGLEIFLESEFEKFKTHIASNFNGILKGQLKEIINNINLSRNTLEYLLQSNSRNKWSLLDKLISVKIECCSEAIRFLDYSTLIFNNQTEVKSQQPILHLEPQTLSKPLKPKKQFEHLTNLTKNQVVILSHYLKELGYFGKEMPKSMYAQYISELTGFTSEKIRQSLSHISKESDSIESGTFQEVDYSFVKRSLKKVIDAIEIDSKEKF